MPTEPRANRLAVLSLLAIAQGVREETLKAIIQREEVRMAFWFQEHGDERYAEGVQDGVEKGARGLLTRQIRRRFPRDTRLAELLPNCSPDDLDWLAEELVSARSAATLARQLEARLARRPREDDEEPSPDDGPSTRH